MRLYKLLSLITLFSLVSCFSNEIPERSEVKASEVRRVKPQTPSTVKTVAKTSVVANNARPTRPPRPTRQSNRNSNQATTYQNSSNSMTSHVTVANNFQYDFPAFTAEWFRIMKETRKGIVETNGNPEAIAGFNSIAIQNLYDPQFCPPHVADKVNKEVVMALTSMGRLRRLNPELVKLYLVGDEIDAVNDVITSSK